MIDMDGNGKWNEMKREMGLFPDRNLEFDSYFADIEKEISVGLRNLDSYLPEIKKKFDLRLPRDYSLTADMISRFKTNKSIWPMITQIKQRCRCGLLTNMYPGMLQAIEKSNLLPDISWDVIINSSVEKVQKPDRRIYEIAEKKAGAKHEEILFVDNRESNIKASSDFGWKTFLYDPMNQELSNKKLMDYFFKEII